MQAWRRSAKAQLELQRVQEPASAGTFAADAARYLKAVAALPDIVSRRRDISLWVALFGARRRQAIHPHEIRAQRDTWLLRGPKQVYDRTARRYRDVAVPLAASTVNHRLRALQNLYTVLDPNGDNPVKHVPEVAEPPAQDRSLPYDVIDAILAVMPDRGPGLRHTRRTTVSKSKARLRLMAYTGLTTSQVMALTQGDFDLVAPAVRVAGRRKGKGSTGGWRPLPQDAVMAMKAFAEAGAFGRFSRHSLRQSWQRACLKLGLPRIRPYDLRHSYATAVLEQTQDMKATQSLLSHADARTTARYAHRAIPAWLAAAVARVRFRA